MSKLSVLDKQIIDTINTLIESVERDYDPKHMLPFKRGGLVRQAVAPADAHPLIKTAQRRGDNNLSLQAIAYASITSGEVFAQDLVNSAFNMQYEAYAQGNIDAEQFWGFTRDQLEMNEDVIQGVQADQAAAQRKLERLEEFVTQRLKLTEAQKFQYKALVELDDITPPPRYKNLPKYSAVARSANQKIYDNAIDYLYTKGFGRKEAAKFVKYAVANGVPYVDLDYINSKAVRTENGVPLATRTDYAIKQLQYVALDPKKAMYLKYSKSPFNDGRKKAAFLREILQQPPMDF